ncbi:MAG: RNA 2'-phosphotransferase [Balneolaceae bacterium]|nr:RNA 2'-phosphotransferase [Balneolaceae bacterium]
MNSGSLKHTSKFLSYILRHHPESIGLEVDRQGWAYLPKLIEKTRQEGRDISREIIDKVMAKGGKQRFTLSADGNYIRAGYGHSIEVNLDLEPKSPPEILYHGTARRKVDSIYADGLHSGSRKMVHLTASKADATEVGSRHGKPQLLTVLARLMYEQGHPFYQSDSEPSIWLVDSVPAQFIEQ